MTERHKERLATGALDGLLALIFVALTVGLVVAMAAVPAFFDWAFARHHNVASWYVRPLFLIPFALFAYRRSLAGIFATLFLLATSMFWFPEPAEPDPLVADFLRVEMEYLTGAWTVEKLVASALVPLTLAALAAALWRRNLLLGLSVLVLIAVMKVTWSVLEAVEAGLAVIAPAVGGLLACVVLIWFGVRRARRRAS
jgi:hypothetical protein